MRAQLRSRQTKNYFEQSLLQITERVAVRRSNRSCSHLDELALIEDSSFESKNEGERDKAREEIDDLKAKRKESNSVELRNANVADKN